MSDHDRQQVLLQGKYTAKQKWRSGRMNKKKIAIQVKDLDKVYKLYDKPSDRLKEALGLTKKEKI